MHPFIVNKRLDEWVTEESLDTRKVHFPRRDGGGSNTGGISTPKKLHIGAGGSAVLGSGISSSSSGGGGGVGSGGGGGAQSVSR